MISGLPMLPLVMISELLSEKVLLDSRCFLVLAAVVAALDFVFPILDVMMMMMMMMMMIVLREQARLRT